MRAPWPRRIDNGSGKPTGRAAAPRRMNSGSSSPTARIARAGELTPPGIKLDARRKSSERVPSVIALQPLSEVLRPVRDDEIGAGAADRGQRLERSLSLVEPAA